MNWELRSSSVLAPQKDNTYETKNMEDGNAKTAWCEGADDDGCGEWFECVFVKGMGKEAVCSGISLTNGYAKNEAAWKENSRVRTLRVELNGKPLQEIALRDTMYPQHATFRPGIKVKIGDRLRFVITSVYRGSKYADTAISDMTLTGAH
ncbi:MAG: hypothetical protein RDV48_29035 [Candidatus Eremiobacteraeota bacterium]|nr:hypothetical protein [Candidatus Eremiobacteraeota bacterium]